LGSWHLAIWSVPACAFRGSDLLDHRRDLTARTEQALAYLAPVILACAEGGSSNSAVTAKVGPVTGSTGEPTDDAAAESARQPLFDVLQVGASVTGLAGPEPVKIIAIERLTDDSANVTYRTATGLAERIVFADMVHHIRAVKPGLSFSFDAGPNAFLLAAEARRMRLAYLFDPQAALGTSDVQPLPHQLRAVYETMLVGAGNSVTLCDLGVFVDQAADPVPAQNAHTGHFGRRMRASGGRLLLQ